MTLKEKITSAIQTELEPLGFRYLKSANDFKRIVDKNTTLYLGYLADCFHRDFIVINLYPAACFRDIEEIQYKLTGCTVARNGHLRLTCRLQWLMPEGESAYWDFRFQESDDEDTYNRKVEKLLWRIKTYALPYLERLTNKDSAIAEAINLDRNDCICFEGIASIMYCLWKHDKKAALDCLEEKRLRLLKLVKPEEWEILERFNNGERFGNKNPVQASIYMDYLDFVAKFKEWMKEQ